MDADSEFRDDMVLETSPEGAGATDGALAQNEGENHLASGEGDLPVRQEVGAALCKVMKVPKIAQRPPFSHLEPDPPHPNHMRPEQARRPLGHPRRSFRFGRSAQVVALSSLRGQPGLARLYVYADSSRWPLIDPNLGL